jgi:hypothetical protein
MTGRPEMRIPARALESAMDRAEIAIRNEASFTIVTPEPEAANFAALYLARRYGLALPLARTVAALASIGRAFL